MSVIWRCTVSLNYLISKKIMWCDEDTFKYSKSCVHERLSGVINIYKMTIYAKIIGNGIPSYDDQVTTVICGL
jgi:hypothetical protein